MGNQKVGFNKGGFIAVSDTDGAFGWKTVAPVCKAHLHVSFLLK